MRFVSLKRHAQIEAADLDRTLIGAFDALLVARGHLFDSAFTPPHKTETRMFLDVTALLTKYKPVVYRRLDKKGAKP